MSENKKEIIVDNVKKGDSIVKMDEKQVDSVKAPKEYVKVTDLSIDDINALPKFSVEIKLIERTYNGNVNKYPSLTLKLGPGLELSPTKDLFKEADFYYLKTAILVPKYKLAADKNEFLIKCPVRFCKGIKLDNDGNPYDYHYIQILIAKGVTYSVYLNKKNRELDLFNTYQENGVIPKVEWLVNNSIVKTDSDGSQMEIFE